MYRSVVSQQGRVTLEADANEAEDIRTAESRAELIDLIGATGTPDDGFKISAPGDGTFDFAIGPGTMYLGGARVQRVSRETYLHQRKVEWADRPVKDPDQPAPDTPLPFAELVYLAVTEQEVSAVEDPALREVALGGPDTAARTRLIPRVHRAGTKVTDCEAALEAVLKERAPGLVFDPLTTKLESASRLRVDFVPVPGTADPCQPAAQAGFLGAENQLIRVQVTGERKLLWGYDNASVLYRAAIKSKRTIALEGSPVDVFHRPRPQQWVEVLGTAVNLGRGVCIASAVGDARELAGYDVADNLITLSADLSQELLDSRPPQIFVRMWEDQIPFVGDTTTATELFTRGQQGASTGVRVYTSGTAVPGDYWMIGVRPSMPQAVFPARLTQLQPPDGPSRWATPLATIAWNVGTPASIHDCRRPFDNLVELTRQQCCEVKVLPGDDVQKIVRDRIRWNAAHGITGLHVRFAAGVFRLDQPLLFDALKGGDLTVSGCGTRLVASTQETALVLSRWSQASVFDLSVESAVAKPRDRTEPGGEAFAHLGGALTFRNCGSANVERVVAVCGSGDRRAASCLTIYNDETRPGDAVVRASDFSIGTRQVGLLLVNVNRGTVDQNRIRLDAHAIASIPPDVIKRWLIGNVAAGTLEGTTPPRAAEPIRVRAAVVGDAGPPAPTRLVREHELPGGQVLRYVTAEALAPAWSAAFTALDARINLPGARATVTRKDRRRIQLLTDAVVAQIMTPERRGPLEAGLVDPFRKWLAEATRADLAVAAAGQGIVVAGARAGDIRVLHNTIADAMDGVHIGLSRRGERSVRLSADRVQVVGNSIAVRVPWYDRGARAGIFIGNVDFATVRDNRVDVQQIQGIIPDAGDGPVIGSHVDQPVTHVNRLTRRADAIRVWGVPGPMLLVTGNMSQHADIGIHVVHVRGSQTASLGLLTQNLAVDAAVAIEASADVTVATDNVP